VIDRRWYEKPDGIPEETAAGGVVVRFEKGKPLVALIREASYNDYFLPKGKVEKGETLEEAAVREIEEEAGLRKLRLVHKIGVTERLNYKRSAWKTTHYYLFFTEQKKGRPTDKKHKYKLVWAVIDDLPEMFWPEQGQIVKDSVALLRDFIESIVV